ncbi:M23 family metallopeptidase [Sulfurimonas paralvinellae]|uniref:M23 family metallopeptidase n=1 Tax=Sulfurimonas paralvinellae TaxID=317658 RepID=A0A7M1B6G8_9BACT|nr:M23 family metallopeptidase [Sulfurimonas paralvinellae]
MRRRKNNSSFGVLFVLVLIIAAGLYVYFSATFERKAPSIVLQNSSGFWNLKKPLKLTIKDDSGVQAYKIVMHTQDGDKTLQYEKLLNPQKEVDLEIAPPRGAYTMKDKEIKLIVEAQDTSKWNFLKGNLAQQAFKLKIDKKRPSVSIVGNSYKISKGGSALVVFKVDDENLEDLYILSNHNKHFKAEPFYKEGYYIALLAWPVKDSGFKATVVATDAAGNVGKAYVPLYLKNKDYRLSKITISDKFLNGKIAELADQFEETQGVDNKLEQFKIINEDIRAKNEKLIHKITSKVPEEMIENFKMKKLYPLKNGQVVAYFGDHRKYYYKGKFISEAYHLGLDMASHAMAPIVTQNGGEVVFADYNGLYGNNLILSHGLGLYTLYGHCSSFDVNVGEDVGPNTKIASTGKTGYAMGDHLHFGVLVQGIEVRPQEWMDKQWIKLNISDIIKNAKKIIDEQ